MNALQRFCQHNFSQDANRAGKLFVREQLEKHFHSCTALIFLIWAIVGCSSVHNIRPDLDTPNYQKIITVMTFNIRHGCGDTEPGNSNPAFFRGCPKKFDLIVSAIRSVNPDVIGLQETSSGQAERIARSLNMNFVYSTHNSGGYGSWWGNAVLSRFKILKAQRTAIGGAGGIIEVL